MLKKFVILSFLIAIIIIALSLIANRNIEISFDVPLKRINHWDIRSVDTVKFSRDLAREKINDPSFDLVIQKQTADIASLGATHIAISTPYDPEFLPYLKKWVLAARQNKLKVWFRGNFSGWENWFDYPRINREEHKEKLQSFIKNNPDLFEDGDIFTSCPECENGGPGDPRHNGDVEGHRKFLIEEYNISNDSFKEINKKVESGYYSMNYDVANLVMDENTTDQLGNLIVIDHYIKDPEKLAVDSKLIADKAKGKVVIGEFGAPIPDIHGNFSGSEQSEWIEKALSEIKSYDEIVGVNYWTNVGGSTGLWNEDGSPRQVVEVIKKFFKETKLVSPR